MKTVKMDEMAMVDEDMIPLEERATTDVVPAGPTAVVAEPDEVTIVPTSAEVSIVTNNVEAMIPAEEREIEDVEESEYATAAEQGFFSEGIGMGRIELKNGPTIYANIHVDKNHRMAFEFRQQLSNGAFSPMISVRKSDLELAVGSNFNAKDISIPKLRNRLNTFLADIVSEFWDTGMDYAIVNIFRILKTISFVQDQLPVYSDCDEQPSRIDFYRDVVGAIQGRGRFQPLMLAYSAKTYYPLTSEEMDFVARQFKLSATELAKKLDRFGFLYRPESTKGYQRKVRICSDEKAKDLGISPFDNCYCVLKLDYISQQCLNAKNP